MKAERLHPRGRRRWLGLCGSSRPAHRSPKVWPTSDEGHHQGDGAADRRREYTFDTGEQPQSSRPTRPTGIFWIRRGLDPANYWTAVRKQNRIAGQSLRQCQKMLADVVSYSFAYNVPSATQRNLIKNCASDPEKYFDPPSNAALVDRTSSRLPTNCASCT